MLLNLCTRKTKHPNAQGMSHAKRSTAAQERRGSDFQRTSKQIEKLNELLGDAFDLQADSTIYFGEPYPSGSATSQLLVEVCRELHRQLAVALESRESHRDSETTRQVSIAVEERLESVREKDDAKSSSSSSASDDVDENGADWKRGPLPPSTG